MPGLRPGACTAALAAFLLAASSASAQNQGFQLNRYEPTTAGETSFWVDHPWYSSTRYFAAGVTLNYAHNPLVFGQQQPDGSFTQSDAIVAHQLIGHIDLAGSFLDRVTASLSLPITLYEGGTAHNGVMPLDGVSVGDPRLGVMVRLWGQPDRSPFSISLGGSLFIPLRKYTDSLPQQQSDQEVRGLPKLVLAGLGRRIRWSFTFGVLIRSEAILGMPVVPDGSSTGTSVQMGALLQYADLQRRFAVGPEALLNSVVTGGHAFTPDYTSLELLLGGHYNLLGQVQLGLAGGIGVLREPGTPDGRLLFRAAYAPLRSPKALPPRDGDGDGIPDRDDACPGQAGVPTHDQSTHGCPPPRDEDSDGVPDSQDACPREPSGAQPDPQRPGCPAPDRDADGVPDVRDACPDEAAGAQPDPQRPGCPAPDSDGDGVIDGQDQCPREPAGAQPDPDRRGCPLPDQDGDGVPDKLDACRQVAGIPDLDPKKNGCPGLVEIKEGYIEIQQQIFFKNSSGEIQERRSKRILEAVVNLLKAKPDVKKVEVAGRSSDRGKAAANLALSEARAQSVMRWLVEHGIAPSRLQAHGYGAVPLQEGMSKHKQRKRNRRVEFRIIDPPQELQPAAGQPRKTEPTQPAQVEPPKKEPPSP